MSARKASTAQADPAGRFDLLGVLAGIDDQPAAGILEQVGVVGGPQHGVERGRHDAGLDRAPEQIEEGRAVLDDHQQAVAGLEPRRQQGIAGAVHSFGELGGGDRLARRANCDLGAAAFTGVPVDERHSDIEAAGQPDHEVRSEFDALDHPDDFLPVKVYVSCSALVEPDVLETGWLAVDAALGRGNPVGELAGLDTAGPISDVT